jgi:hypothetical protein
VDTGSASLGIKGRETSHSLLPILLDETTGHWPLPVRDVTSHIPAPTLTDSKPLTYKKFAMFIIQDNLKCIYWHLVASSSYRISLMCGHGLFKKQTNILSSSLVTVHNYKDYAQISLYESTEQK